MLWLIGNCHNKLSVVFQIDFRPATGFSIGSWAQASLLCWKRRGSMSKGNCGANRPLAYCWLFSHIFFEQSFLDVQVFLIHSDYSFLQSWLHLRQNHMLDNYMYLPTIDCILSFWSKENKSLFPFRLVIIVVRSSAFGLG